MNKTDRLVEIDLLRGLAMFAMIIIHTSVYFLSDSPIIFYLWNFSQFAVPLFVFCSAYLFFKKNYQYSKKSFIDYIKKRFIRLLKPYYIFMLIFFAAILLREPHKLTPGYIWQSITVTGGIDINWLVLLFLCFTFLMPMIGFLYKKNKLFFWIFTAFSVISSVIFIFWNAYSFNKYIMWLPWSSFLVFTFLILRFEKQKFFYLFSLCLSLISFLAFRYLEILHSHSLTMYDNKYPPTIYFLSFGILSITLLYFLAQKRIFEIALIKQLFTFLSTNSYSLYFIHYVLLYLISGMFTQIHFNWITFFLTVICSSIAVQIMLNRFGEKYTIAKD